MTFQPMWNSAWSSPDFGGRSLSQFLAMLPGALLMTTLAMSPSSLAEELPSLTEEQVLEQAKGAWESGAIHGALELLEHGLQDHPDALVLYKLRGDILASSRGLPQAVEAYETVLATIPAALDVRWAKWSVLVRSGQGDESIAELRRIADIDGRNPLIHLRLAQELRNLNRLEESVESYKMAVDLVPEMLSWRLALARARFDVLDYKGADADVQYVLDNMPPGSPLELPANTLLSVVHGSSQERGRRFEPVFSKDVTPAARKEWALMRADAWRLFVAGRYHEAEPMYRKLLALNPRDPNATHQFGLTLMQVGKCKEALSVFGKISDLDPADDQYADTVYRMGQCLVELEQWEEAYVQFQTLYDEAIAFEKQTKNVQLPPGTRVLDKKKIARWLDRIRPHVPELAKQSEQTTRSAGDAEPTPTLSDEERYAMAIDRLKPEKPLDLVTSLMGRDADFSLFRFVIPAGKVLRDDSPTGAHDFIPLNANDSFSVFQHEIYLVFGLVTDSYDAVPLTARCSVETPEVTGEPRAVAQDQVMMSMNDQSGYFKLLPSASGWAPGLYRCGLFAGERTSAYTRVDEVRFRIVEPTRPS